MNHIGLFVNQLQMNFKKELAICRGIAEVHGGKLTAQASALGGLQLTLTLPAAGDDA